MNSYVKQGVDSVIHYIRAWESNYCNKCYRKSIGYIFVQWYYIQNIKTQWWHSIMSITIR